MAANQLCKKMMNTTAGGMTAPCGKRPIIVAKTTRLRRVRFALEECLARLRSAGLLEVGQHTSFEGSRLSEERPARLF